MWQIIGAGAIGCLWAANLKRNGEDVHLVMRTAAQSNILCYQDLQQQITEIAISCGAALKNDHAPILVCVKATQVEQAILKQRTLISDKQPIILMHNGMGCAEKVAKLLPKNPIICATTANASLLKSPLNIQQTGIGITYLGAFNELAYNYKDLVIALNRALNDTHWVDDIKEKLWLKLLINVAINPLTAIWQIKNGQLLAPKFTTIIKTIVHESILVSDAEGLPFSKSQLLDTITQVIRNTAENYSSMNRDIHFQRQTENEYISGYLLAKASEHQINVPTITKLYQKINQHSLYNEGVSLSNSIR